MESFTLRPAHSNVVSAELGNREHAIPLARVCSSSSPSGPLSESQSLLDRLRTVRREMMLLRHRFLPGAAPYPGFGEPFNGQRIRLSTVRRLIEIFSPD